MSTEIYINHPNFGLLYRLCILDTNQELFTTLYAQRLFFKVNIEFQDIRFEPLSRSEARILMENKLRFLRSEGQWETYKEVNNIYKNIFQ